MMIPSYAITSQMSPEPDLFEASLRQAGLQDKLTDKIIILSCKKFLQLSKS